MQSALLSQRSKSTTTRIWLPPLGLIPLGNLRAGARGCRPPDGCPRAPHRARSPGLHRPTPDGTGRRAARPSRARARRRALDRLCERAGPLLRAATVRSARTPLPNAAHRSGRTPTRAVRVLGPRGVLRAGRAAPAAALANGSGRGSRVGPHAANAAGPAGLRRQGPRRGRRTRADLVGGARRRWPEERAVVGLVEGQDGTGVVVLGGRHHVRRTRPELRTPLRPAGAGSAATGARRPDPHRRGRAPSAAAARR